MARLPVWLTRVRSNSMMPSLRDEQLVWTVSVPRRHRLRRGAIVAVDSRELGLRIVKRVVGLPGEQLQLHDGEVSVDGHPLAEPHATLGTDSCSFDVPEGHYLLLGDDRSASSDARRWRNPYVARAEIVGILVTRRVTVRLGPGGGDRPHLLPGNRLSETTPQRE